MRFQEKIGTLTKTSTTQVQLSGLSLIKLGGQFYSLNSPTLLTSTSGIGGLDTGAIAASSFYYVYAVSNGTTQGIVASLSATSPSGFTRYKKVGAFLTDSGSLVDKIFNLGLGSQFVQSISFLASGNYSKPSYLDSIIVELVGGGGAGGTGSSPSGGGGGGGGGGGYSKKFIRAADLSLSETVTVAPAAGSSSFGSHCSATGGGTGGGPGQGGGAAGVGSGGDVNLRGQGGGCGTAPGGGGAGGGTQLGGGAAGDGSGVGTAGTPNTGGGGSGGYNGAGGAGATGRVIVHEYISL